MGYLLVFPLSPLLPSLYFFFLSLSKFSSLSFLHFLHTLFFPFLFFLCSLPFLSYYYYLKKNKYKILTIMEQMFIHHTSCMIVQYNNKIILLQFLLQVFVMSFLSFTECHMNFIYTCFTLHLQFTKVDL